LSGWPAGTVEIRIVFGVSAARLVELSEESGTPAELVSAVVKEVRRNVDSEATNHPDNISVVVHQQGFDEATATAVAPPQETIRIAPKNPVSAGAAAVCEALTRSETDDPIEKIFSSAREWLNRHMADPTIRDKTNPTAKANSGFRVEVG
jgi:hypothetical protein